MLANQIRKIFSYNNWAWTRVLASVKQLEESSYHAPRQLFETTTIHTVLVHCLSAEFVWLERCQGRSPESLFGPREFADAAAVQRKQAELAAGWGSYLAELDDADFQRLVIYRNTRGDQYALPLKDICQHVVNHATEHRSQITPFLYSEGVPTKPLDYFLFSLDN